LVARIKRAYGFSFQKYYFFQRKVLRTLLAPAQTPQQSKALQGFFNFFKSIPKKRTKNFALFFGGDEGSRTPVQNGSKQISTNVVFIFLVIIKEKTNLYNYNKAVLSVTHFDS